MNVFVGPIHFRDVNKTLDTFLDFGKTTVIGEVSHSSINSATFWVAIGNFYPWIFAQLFQTQRDPIALAVELKDFDIHFLTNFYNLAGVLDALPSHIRDVQQAINTAEINKGTVISQIFNHAFNRHAFLQILE